MKARSVDFSLRTLNCAGVNIVRHSAADFTTLLMAKKWLSNLFSLEESREMASSPEDGRALNPDDLEWTRLDDDIGTVDDSEIFYGLEEVDNVTVERENGAARFVARDSRNKKGQNKKKKLKKTGEKPDEKLGSDFQALSSLEPEITELGQWPPLNPALLTALKKMKYLEPTAIQKETIPLARQGLDVIGKAATGSGKTLAYGLPILDAYLNDNSRGLVIAPTRELAHQIRDHLSAVCAHSSVLESSKIVAVTGGLAIQKQLRQLEKNQPAVVVATPGRLLEILESMDSATRREWQRMPTLVLDEADRLVQANSFQELESVLNILGRPRPQNLVFSATFEPELWTNLGGSKKRKRVPDIQEVLAEKLGLKKQAHFVDADPREKVAPQIYQAVIECSAHEKDLLLYYFCLLYPGKTIAFVNSIDSVKRVAPLLKELGMEAFGVHSDMVQKQRLRSLERFRDSSNGVLVATDVAARGLDVPLVDHVLHYHLPRSADMYIHRSGRTARAGNEGVSVVLCSPQESSGPLPRLTKLVGTKPKPFDVDYAVLDRLRDRISLAKRIADAATASTKLGKSKAWEAKAAEDLGVDLSSDDEGSGNRSADSLQHLRAELRQLLKTKIVFNRRYLTGGSVNIAQAMLSQPNSVIAGRPMVSALDTLQSKKKERKTSMKPRKPLGPQGRGKGKSMSLSKVIDA